VNRRIRAAFDALVRLMLVLGLACSPLAQPMAMAALAAPQPETAAGCPHHSESAQVGSNQSKPGECCYQKGSPCHCAMALALPTSALPATAAAGSDHPVSAPRLIASILPSPEPPPPRT
jgi:hypothetical protein